MARKRRRDANVASNDATPATAEVDCPKSLESRILDFEARVVAAEDRVRMVEEHVIEVKSNLSDVRESVREKMRSGITGVREEMRAGITEIKDETHETCGYMRALECKMHTMLKNMGGTLDKIVGVIEGKTSDKQFVGSPVESEGMAESLSDVTSDCSGAISVVPTTNEPADNVEFPKNVAMNIAETCPAGTGPPCADSIEPTPAVKQQIPVPKLNSVVKPLRLQFVPAQTPAANLPGNSAKSYKTPAKSFPASLISNRSRNSQTPCVSRCKAKLEPYDAKTMSFPEYLRHMEAVANCNEWDEEVTLSQFAASLRGRALTVYTELPSEECVDLNAVIQHFWKRCHRPGRETHLRAEFNLRKKQPNETPAEFAAALGVLAREAFPGVDVQVQDDFIRQQFVTGFADVSLCKHLALSRADQIDELVASADLYISIENAHKGVNFHSPKPVVAAASIARASSPSPSTSSEASEEFKQILELLREVKEAMVTSFVQCLERNKPAQNPNSRKRNSPGQSRRPAGPCHGCGEPGHIVRNCPQSRCLKCQQLGHLMYNCPTTTPSEGGSSTSSRSALNSN